jgi:biotin operon repressor
MFIKLKGLAMTTPSTAHDLAVPLKVIADETRLRILGSLASAPRTGKELASELDLTPPTISHHMRKLTEAGIVVASSDAQRQWYRLNSEFLSETKKVPLKGANAPEREPENEEERFRSKVLRDFFVGDRLKEIPAQRKRRVIVLQHVVERFAPDRTYSEREVNDLLRPVHEDVATLRRELVDYGFLQRDRGIYQLTRGAPVRSANVNQEFIGDENEWFRALVSRVTKTGSSSTQDH